MLPALLGAIGRGVAVNAMTKPDKHVDAPDKQRLAESFPKFGISSPSFKPSNITNASSLPTTAVNDNSITSKTADGIFKSVLNVLTRIEQSMKQQVQLAIADNKANREMMLEKGDNANAFGKSGEDTGIRNATDEMGLLGTALAAGVLGVIAFKDEIAEGVKTMKSLWEWVNKNIVSKMPDAVSFNESLMDPSSGRTANTWTEGLMGGHKDDVVGPAGNNKTTNYQRGVYSAFKKAGYSRKGALALSAEVGRENSFDPNLMFGGHRDPHNKATNVGIFSYQGDRNTKLKAFMKERGLMKKNGSFNQSQASLDAMAEFTRTEMNQRGEGDIAKYLSLENADRDKAARMLGKRHIKWRFDDPKYAHHHAARNRYYNQVEQATANQPLRSIDQPKPGFNATGGLWNLTQKTLTPSQAVVPVKKLTPPTPTKPPVKFNSSLKPATASIPSRRATKTAMASPTVIAPTIVQGNQGTAGRGSGGVPAPGKTPTTLSYQQYFRV